MFLTLSKQMGNLRNTLNSQSEFAQSLALKIVTDLILPAVKWQAGRKNEAVRIAGNDFQWFKLELVSKELNHLAAILHDYAGSLIFMK